MIVTKASFADVVKFIITFDEKYGQTVTSNLALKKNEKPTQTQTLMLRKVVYVSTQQDTATVVFIKI